jgi:hypothetical protein
LDENVGFRHSSTGLLQVGTTHVCTASWGVYGSDAFTSSQVNHANHPPLDFDKYSAQPGNTDGLFVFPDKHFALCVITKVGSSQWAEVLMKMAMPNMSLDETAKQDPHFMKEKWKEIVPSFKGTPAEKMAVFSNPNAIRAVFVRDPIERFASAFLMLCESGENFNGCPIRTNSSQVLTMKTAVEWAARGISTGLGLDAHWNPQSSMCELRSRINEYNIIGLYSKEHFSEDSACVLEAAGLSAYSSIFAEAERTDSRNAWSTSTKAEETALLQRLFTREGANSLLSTYKDDYAMFKFPLPEWIEGATGELYDVDVKTIQDH